MSDQFPWTPCDELISIINRDRIEALKKACNEMGFVVFGPDGLPEQQESKSMGPVISEVHEASDIDALNWWNSLPKNPGSVTKPETYKMAPAQSLDSIHENIRGLPEMHQEGVLRTIACIASRGGTIEEVKRILQVWRILD